MRQIEPAETAVHPPLADAPLLERVQLDGQPVLGLVLDVTHRHAEPLSEEGLDRVLHEPDEILECGGILVDGR